ncbi:MAG: class I SAM-dependent methyltransferase [Betaproteobacteria bacterium]|nr:MAG: class I SAM-dependent methyltransferase [Betaproteobacteria bacterium]
MTERVGRGYWDSSWEAEKRLPEAFDPAVKGVRSLFRRPFHRFIDDCVRRVAAPGSSLIEIGCGRSQLLPYFAKQFGLRVAGLDYSPIGCDKARQILRRERIDGEIYCGDLWTFDAFPSPGYDLVFSFGLVEHFENTAAVIGALARFARPGGALLTLIPNMRGSVGALQRTLSREIYDIHVPLSADDLSRAHMEAGLSVKGSGYLLPAHYGVCNQGTRMTTQRWQTRGRRFVHHAAVASSTVLLWVHEYVVRLPATKWMSPYAFTLATTSLGEPAAGTHGSGGRATP